MLVWFPLRSLECDGCGENGVRGQGIGSGRSKERSDSPATVARVQVLDNVGQVKLLESVLDALAVALGAVLAGLEVDVGDEVGERVGLDDESEGRVGLALDDLGNGCLCQCLL